jgi:hypothetical protein
MRQVDALVGDVKIAVEILDNHELAEAVAEVARLLAELAGQDVEEGDDGVFRIAEKVAKDRIISVVDSEARHGHKSHDRKFDGFKTHLSIDPDSELIDQVAVTAANAAGHDAVDDLLAPGGWHDGQAGRLFGTAPMEMGRPYAAWKARVSR